MLKSTFIGLLLPAFALAITHLVFDKDAYLITTAVFESKYTVVQLKGEYNLYVTSAEPQAYWRQIKIDQQPDSGGAPIPQKTLEDFYHYVDGNNRLQPTPLSNTKITISDHSNVPGNAVLLFVSKNKDKTPVFDASKGAMTVTADSKWIFSVKAITFLNAQPYFTLSNFQIGAAADIAVYASPYHLADTHNYDALIDITHKEYAKNSFVAIIGPIATVTMEKLDIKKASFSVSSDNTNWFNASFLPGSQISVSSPGFMSTSLPATLPHFFPYNRLIGHWTSTRDSAITYDIRIPSGINGFNFQSLSGGGVSTTNNGATQTNVKTTAKEFKLDYANANSNSRFLIQIISGGNTLTTSIATLMFSWLAFSIRQ